MVRVTGTAACTAALLALVACSSNPASPSKNSGDGDGAGGETMNNTGGAAPSGDPNFHVYLLIGQSNMEGMAKPEAQDRMLNDRVKVLSYDNCASFAREYNQWYTASPPLHGCFAGVGPGDNFGKTLADAYPEATIGLVPCAIAGVDIAFFRKGVVSTRRDEFKIPPDNQLSGAYEWVVERARLAQQTGVIKGIIFHQGESDTGRAAWLDDVQGMVADLRADLGIGDVPFLAGELLYGGCCDAHNPIIAQIPERIPNSFVISAEGLKGQDDAHFDLAGQREFGVRYGQKMLEALR